MKAVIAFLKKILLAIELIFAFALIHWEKTLFLAVLALDQFSKMYVVNSMTLGASIPIVEKFFHITYVLNPGAAFGILPNQRVFFLIIGIMLLIWFALFYPRIKKFGLLIRVATITGVSGSTANLIDRFQTGYVIDFLDFKIWSPVFNFADVAITLSMIVILYFVIFKMEDDGNLKEARR